MRAKLEQVWILHDLYISLWIIPQIPSSKKLSLLQLAVLKIKGLVMINLHLFSSDPLCILHGVKN